MVLGNLVGAGNQLLSVFAMCRVGTRLMGIGDRVCNKCAGSNCEGRIDKEGC